MAMMMQMRLKAEAEGPVKHTFDEEGNLVDTAKEGAQVGHPHLGNYSGNKIEFTPLPYCNIVPFWKSIF